MVYTPTPSPYLYCLQILHRLLDDPHATVSSLIDTGEYTRITDREQIRRHCESVVQDNPEVRYTVFISLFAVLALSGQLQMCLLK